MGKTCSPSRLGPRTRMQGTQRFSFSQCALRFALCACVMRKALLLPLQTVADSWRYNTCVGGSSAAGTAISASQVVEVSIKQQDHLHTDAFAAYFCKSGYVNPPVALSALLCGPERNLVRNCALKRCAPCSHVLVTHDMTVSTRQP
jgi:hypothetical protein